MTGITPLIPKNEIIERPKNFRPITWLPTIYKTITSIISKQMQKYIDERILMAKEQKERCRGSKGCKDRYYYQKPYYRNVRAGRKIYNKI
jgi:hypothetical protein